jgi:hypothetical protein
MGVDATLVHDYGGSRRACIVVRRALYTRSDPVGSLEA